MKASWLLVLLAGAALAGCTGADPANPNLAAPKLVLQARPDGNVTLFIHGAFGDRLYDWIGVDIDNETLVNRSIAFSAEEIVPASGFFFEASARTTRETYSLRGRADLDAQEARVKVAFLDDQDDWSDTQSFALPFERVLVRRDSS